MEVKIKMDYKTKMRYYKKRTGIPGWDRMCSSGCPRTKNKYTMLVGESRRSMYGGPVGYWSI